MKFKVALLSLAITGCASKATVDILENEARADADRNNSRAKEIFDGATAVGTESFVREVRTPILTSRVAPIKRVLPPIFANRYSFRGNGEQSLINVVKLFTSDTSMIVTARDDVFNPTGNSISATDGDGDIDAAAAQLADEARQEGNLEIADRVKLPAGTNYDGTVEGFLDYLSSILNISWEYLHDENRILLTRYVEKSYRLFVPPAGEGGTSKIWGSTEAGVAGLLSTGGSVTVNQDAGLISVVDTHDVQKMVEQHIQTINESLQRSVFFEMEILSVSMTESESKGFDFDAIHTGAKSSVSLIGGTVSVPGAAGLTGSITDGPFQNSRFITQNLSTAGEVSTTLSRVVRTMNNQSANIEQKKIIPVIAEYTPPVTSGGVTTPGGVTTEDIEVGFSMAITPNVMSNGQDLAVRVELETSNIDEIIDIPIGNDGQLVQSARRTSRTYDHTFSMSNAETILISGFFDGENVFKSSEASTSWLSWLFSSVDDSIERTYYVIVLTPQVVNGSGAIR